MRKLYQFLSGILAIIFFLWGISAYMQSRTGSASDKLVIYNWGGSRNNLVKSFQFFFIQ